MHGSSKDYKKPTSTMPITLQKPAKFVSPHYTINSSRV